MQQRFAAGQPETVDAAADDLEDVPGVFERRGGGDELVAARAEVFAVGAVEVALHGDVVDRDVRVQGGAAACDLEQVCQVRAHGVDYILGCAN